ncbi:MAG: hypothetical protein IPL53_05010 [Ignavibacteria bacterium]|nr:hypothetical protein [Ignavibacteria bacterium]
MTTVFRTVCLITSLLFIFFTNDSHCQLKNFGIKGGLNLSNAELQSQFYSTFNGKEFKTGLNAYLTYDFLNFKNVIISAEAGYSQKGFNEVFPLTDEFGNQISTWTVYNRLNYIDVNAIAEFILRNNSVSPYFSFGPVLCFYTGYKQLPLLRSLNRR